MKRKILIISISAVFLLVTISFSTVVSSDTNTEQKESPLFRIRTIRSIREKIGTITYTLKARFIGERMFCLPLILLFGNEDYTDGYLTGPSWSGVTGCIFLKDRCTTAPVAGCYETIGTGHGLCCE